MASDRHVSVGGVGYSRESLAGYRLRLFDAIRRALALDGYHKSAEGLISITFPDYFDSRAGKGEHVTMNVCCYVLGPSRRYEYTGCSVSDCVLRAQDELDGWIAELEEWEREEKRDGDHDD